MWREVGEMTFLPLSLASIGFEWSYSATQWMEQQGRRWGRPAAGRGEEAKSESGLGGEANGMAS